MSNSTRIGGVTVQCNEDGTLFIYQPDSSRVMSSELAIRLIEFVAESMGFVVRTNPDDWGDQPEPQLFHPSGVSGATIQVQSTVPAGVINTTTSAGQPEVIEASAPEGVSVQPEPVKRRPGRPRKTT